MFTKKMSTNTTRYFVRWIIFISVVQTFALLVFNLENSSEGFLIATSNVTALFGFFLYIFVPYSLVRKELMVSRKQNFYSGWLMGFEFSLIFSIILLLFTFLDMELRANLGETDLNSSFIFWGSVVGALMEVVIGTFSGGMAQVVINKKKDKEEVMKH